MDQRSWDALRAASAYVRAASNRDHETMVLIKQTFGESMLLDGMLLLVGELFRPALGRFTNGEAMTDEWLTDIIEMMGECG